MYDLTIERRSYLLDHSPHMESPAELAFMIAHLAEVYLLHVADHDFDAVTQEHLTDVMGAITTAAREFRSRVVDPIQEVLRGAGEVFLFPHPEVWRDRPAPVERPLLRVVEA